MGQIKKQFWKTKSLKAMTNAEWESLCDHCGICCLHSVQDGKTGKIKFLSVACRFLDVSTCRCMIYEDRLKVVSDCERLSPYKIKRIKKLPKTCAYRSLVEGRKLEWWHPLVSGDPNSVHEAGISVKEKVLSANFIHPEDLEYYYVGYP